MVLALFVIIVALDLSQAVPRETRLSLQLAHDDAHFTTATITYTADGELVVHSRQHREGGLPSHIDERRDLSPGHYRVEVELSDDTGGSASREGEFDAPADGLVVVHLHP
jgi:hypothetical protein